MASQDPYPGVCRSSPLDRRPMVGPLPRALKLRRIVPHRHKGRLGAVAHLELLQERSHVVLHRLLREGEMGADLPDGEPLADQVE